MQDGEEKTKSMAKQAVEDYKIKAQAKKDVLEQSTDENERNLINKIFNENSADIINLIIEKEITVTKAVLEYAQTFDEKSAVRQVIETFEAIQKGDIERITILLRENAIDKNASATALYKNADRICTYTAKLHNEKSEVINAVKKYSKLDTDTIETFFNGEAINRALQDKDRNKIEELINLGVKFKGEHPGIYAVVMAYKDTQDTESLKAIIDLLITKEHRVDDKRKNTETALYTSVKEGREWIVKLLLEYEVDLGFTLALGDKLDEEIETRGSSLKLCFNKVLSGADTEEKRAEVLTQVLIKADESLKREEGNTGALKDHYSGCVVNVMKKAETEEELEKMENTIKSFPNIVTRFVGDVMDAIYKFVCGEERTIFITKNGKDSDSGIGSNESTPTSSLNNPHTDAVGNDKENGPHSM